MYFNKPTGRHLSMCVCVCVYAVNIYICVCVYAVELRGNDVYLFLKTYFNPLPYPFIEL